MLELLRVTETNMNKKCNKRKETSRKEHDLKHVNKRNPRNKVLQGEHTDRSRVIIINKQINKPTIINNIGRVFCRSREIVDLIDLNRNYK
jgi:hypothetical protein